MKKQRTFIPVIVETLPVMVSADFYNDMMKSLRDAETVEFSSIIRESPTWDEESMSDC